MEENKNIETKKMSYEELENVAHQLSEQARELYSKLQSANMENMFKRMDYLFRVLENVAIFPEDFVTKCTNEIVDLMTIPEEPSTSD